MFAAGIFCGLERGVKFAAGIVCGFTILKKKKMPQQVQGGQHNE
jgi:hypothetical protein